MLACYGSISSVSCSSLGIPEIPEYCGGSFWRERCNGDTLIAVAETTIEEMFFSLIEISVGKADRRPTHRNIRNSQCWGVGLVGCIRNTMQAFLLLIIHN